MIKRYSREEIEAINSIEELKEMSRVADEARFQLTQVMKTAVKEIIDDITKFDSKINLNINSKKDINITAEYGGFGEIRIYLRKGVLEIGSGSCGSISRSTKTQPVINKIIAEARMWERDLELQERLEAVFEGQTFTEYNSLRETDMWSRFRIDDIKRAEEKVEREARVATTKETLVVGVKIDIKRKHFKNIHHNGTHVITKVTEKTMMVTEVGCIYNDTYRLRMDDVVNGYIKGYITLTADKVEA